MIELNRVAAFLIFGWQFQWLGIGIEINIAMIHKEQIVVFDLPRNVPIPPAGDRLPHPRKDGVEPMIE
jgi:hypothetical protein